MPRLQDQRDSSIELRSKIITLWELGWTQVNISREVGLSVSKFQIVIFFSAVYLSPKYYHLIHFFMFTTCSWFFISL
jgi:hypothetical protein